MKSPGTNTQPLIQPAAGLPTPFCLLFSPAATPLPALFPSPGMPFLLLHEDNSLRPPSGLRSGSPPPKKLPYVPAKDTDNIPLEKGLQVGQCPCKFLRDRGDSGALGVVWWCRV